jgi:hypothetical protein
MLFLRTFSPGALAFFALACSGSSSEMDGGPPPIVPCPFGQLDQPPEMTIVHQERDGTMVHTGTIAELPLFEADQGGQLLRLSARARNMDVCNLVLKTTLRDHCDNHIVGLDLRPLTLEPGDDGWATPKRPERLTNFSSLQTCPVAAENRALYNEPYSVTLRIEDPEGRFAEASTIVIPKCHGEGDVLRRCHCDCRQEFVLGGECIIPPDDGTPPGTCRDDGGM